MKGIIKGVQNLITGIESIFNGIKVAIEFLVGLVKTLWELLKLLATTIGNVLVLLDTIPNWLKVFGVATLGIAVLYIIVGRETGKTK